MNWTELLSPLAANLTLASALWLLSVVRHNAALVDLIWPLMFVMAAWLWFDPAMAGTVHWLVLILVITWGLRLHLHLLVRNWGQPEDRRYRAMRERNNPGFWWKSLVLVFVLQAVLAWIIALVIYAALVHQQSLGIVSVSGLLVMLFGLVFEAVADAQLAAFRRDPGNRGQVMDRGLWRYSRHPNYFGECCLWWGLGLVAVAAGQWWALLSPVLMTFLLLRVSGVSLLESDIGDRRPGYRDYIQRTSAFVPRPPKAQSGEARS